MKNDKNKITLEELLKQLEDNENIEQSQKDKLNSLFNSLKKPPTFYILVRKLKVFIQSLIFNFIGFYLAYGIFMFNYISVSKVNAIYLVLILSTIKSLYKTLRINNMFKKNFFINSICAFLILILIVYYFSNLEYLYHFKSFSSIIIYFIVGQLITDLQEVIITKISLERRLL